MVVSLIVILVVVAILVDYLRSYLRLRALGVPFDLGGLGGVLPVFSALTRPTGLPLVYRLPYFVFRLDSIYDDVLRRQGNGGLRAMKRAIGTPITIVSADWEVNKHVLEHVEVYQKGPVLRQCAMPLLGDGIFNVDGAQWLEQRKAASFMFAKRELKTMVDVFLRHFEELDGHLREGEPVEFQALASNYTLDCFCELAFGIDTGALRGKSAFGSAFNEAQAGTLGRFVFYPWWKVLPSFVFPHERILKSAVAALDEIIFSLIRERRSDSQLSQRTDLLSRLLQHDSFCDDRYVRDAVLNFILAGRDTTAQTILWATYLLSTNPDVRERVEAEARAVEGPLCFESLKSLPYIERFIYETLRLYPPVPGDPKQAAVDDVLPGGVQVYAGEVVLWSQNIMGRQERYFPNPLKVDPDRWLG